MLGKGSGAGWTIWELSDWVDPQELGGLVEALAANGGAGVGASILDSDWAAVVLISGGETVRFLINPHRVEKDPIDEGTGIPQDELRSVSEAIVAWSRVAPTPVDAEEVRRIVSQEWIFAEQAIQQLFNALGMPQPVQAGIEGLEGARVLQDRGSAVVRGRTFSLVHPRYVMGWGEGFYGIWDRNVGGPPIAKFSSSGEGIPSAVEEFVRLIDSAKRRDAWGDWRRRGK